MPKRNLLRLYLPVAAIAAAARLWVYASWLESPLRWFHQVPGLDMQTLLEFGRRLVDGIGLFTLHRTLVAGVWLANGGAHHVECLAAIQCVLGILSALLVTRITFHLSGKRSWALAAGIVTALYSPALMYEVTMLQESIVTFAVLLSFAGWLRARERRFVPVRAVTAGILLGLATIGRPTALLWAGCAVVFSFPPFRRGSSIQRGLLVAAGSVGLWLSVGLLNQVHTGSFNPFFNVFPYAATVNAAPAAPVSAPPPTEGPETPPPSPSPSWKPLLRIGRNALLRIPLLFCSDEIPDNLNFYFIRQEIPPLRFLPGPELLIPAAVAGILLLVGSGRILRREGLVLLIVATLAPPLCGLHPVGRYRLLLYPYFAILAVYAFSWMTFPGRLPRRMRIVIGSGVLVAVFGANQALGTGSFLRSTDFVAWGIAAEYPSGRPTAVSMRSFGQALARSGGRNQSAAVNLLTRLIGLQQFDAALTLARRELEVSGVNHSLMHYYAGLSLLGGGRPAEASGEFAASRPEEIAPLAGKLHFFRGEAERLRGNKEKAFLHYRTALSCRLTPELRKRIEEMQGKLISPEKSDTSGFISP